MVDLLGMFRRRPAKRNAPGFARSRADITSVRDTIGGVLTSPVRDAPPIRVWLAWWADSPPPQLETFRRLVAEEYGAAGQAARAASGRS